jgi:hypothetical protein
VADELSVAWSTVMDAIVEHGTPLVDDPGRVEPVSQLGVDETFFLRANRFHHTIYATGLVDLEAKILIDMVEGNAAADLRRWTATADPEWLKAIGFAPTDLAESFRAGLSPHLDHATRVADPFHVVRAANRCLNKVRRRGSRLASIRACDQESGSLPARRRRSRRWLWPTRWRPRRDRRVKNETLAHRGRKPDPLYQIRKLLLAGTECLNDKGRNRMLLGLRIGDPR